MSLITVSQDFGSGGNVIAQKVAEKLQLELYDDERLINDAIEMGVKEKYLKGLEEKAPGFLDRLMGNKPDSYLDILQSVVFKIARRGSGVIFGHGSQILLKDFGCAFHIRVYAPLDARIQKLMTNEDLTEEFARNSVRKKDEEFKAFFQYSFHKSFNDMQLYDLVLNTGKISIQTAVEHIVSFAKSEEIKACSINALETMDAMALEHKIHAVLLQHDISIRDITIKVKPPGKVRIHGTVYTGVEKKKISKIIKKMPGIDDSQLAIEVAPLFS